MGQLTWNSCELLPSQTCELYAPREAAVDSRTLLKQYLLDPVLPIVTLVVIGSLTLLMLLLLVGAVGNLEQVLHSGGTGNDPWSATAGYSDQQAYAAYVASGEAAADRESWSGPPAYGTTDGAFVRTPAQP